MILRPTAVLSMFLYALCAYAQDDVLPQPPVILDHADSVVGSGPVDAGRREFLGNVRFRQGNVTVTCDRAVHDIFANRLDLRGRVVIVQDGMKLTAPVVIYDGNSTLASAPNGCVVVEGGRTIRSKTATYSTTRKVAVFVDSVRVVDDSMRIWADTVTYDRQTKMSEARGRALLADSSGHRWTFGDTIVYNPSQSSLFVRGNAQAWTIEDEDTTYLAGSVLRTYRNVGIEGNTSIASGSAILVRGNVAARADTMVYDEHRGVVNLRAQPIVWNDSLQMFADSIDINAPARKLSSILGIGSAMLVSRSDTLFPDRYDQLAGERITITVDDDTVRKVVSVGQAKSVTWKSEQGRGEGMVKFASDSIEMDFEDGQPVDIRWLGSIEGEHHPENIVAGRVAEHLLKGFQWHTDRPKRLPLPRPFLPGSGADM
ncbi:MAG TPA: hypothetical protein DIS79_03835 [Bacteroidetes bacterium]|nr:hypothetical protein [Bacteroidota bacterium]HRK03835.1 OstA-like protein [Chlorobiota bacterium]